MPKKRKNRPHGHYCKVCGEYKANEKFSGKGHAAHICKACSKLGCAYAGDFHVGGGLLLRLFHI